ncbi:MAG: AraC family transcriptional regulator ligand-binding domain-containing protein [Polyangiales bacterium]
MRGLSEAVEHMGTPGTAFLANSGLEAARVGDARAWFSLDEFDALLVSALRFTGDPMFGLHWGERSPMMQFDLGPALIASAPTLRNGIESILQMQPLLATREELRFDVQRDRATFECRPLTTSPLATRVRTELLLVCMTRLLRYFGQADAIRRIDIAYAQPDDVSEYTRLLGRHVHFDQVRTTFTFDSAALDTKHPNHNAELHQVLRARTEQERNQALGKLSYTEQLNTLVRATLPSLLSMTDAARLLQTSERSLRRRLAGENLSYSQLVDDVQRTLAHELLELGTQTVKEVAYKSGFSSVSGFHRAFRRWTGSSPARERAPRARVG